MPTIVTAPVPKANIIPKDGDEHHAIAQIAATLTRWAEHGYECAFWLRDDDSTRPSKRLAAFLQASSEATLALAVIPAHAQHALAPFLDRFDPPNQNPQSQRIIVAQHGWRHQNHAPSTQKKMEFGPHRSSACMREELMHGQQKLLRLFAHRLSPGLVPPWNRITMDLFAGWLDNPYRWLSCFGSTSPTTVLPKQHPASAPMMRYDCHLDPVDWRAGYRSLRPFAGWGRILKQLSQLEQQIETTGIDQDTIIHIGLLTHHRVQDHATMRCIQQLIELVGLHKNCYWKFPWQV